MTEHPAALLRRAEALIRQKATAATPGPWERPLDTRHKNSVIAALPDDEEPRQWQGGIIPAEFSTHKGPMGRYAGQRERVGVVSADIWSIGGFIRKRSGRDLDYVASWHPAAALAVADWLKETAKRADDDVNEDTPDCGHEDDSVPCRCDRSPALFCYRCGDPLNDGCHCWDGALNFARAYLSTPEPTL